MWWKNALQMWTRCFLGYSRYHTLKTAEKERSSCCNWGACVLGWQNILIQYVGDDAISFFICEVLAISYTFYSSNKSWCFCFSINVKFYYFFSFQWMTHKEILRFFYGYYLLFIWSISKVCNCSASKGFMDMMSS